MHVGLDAVRAALRELERCHYLVRGREWRPDGTLGEGWMFLTDLPAQRAEIGISSAAPYGGSSGWAPGRQHRG